MPAGAADFSWSGCYVGAHAGGLRGDVDHKVDGTSMAEYQRDLFFSSATVGAHAGCNYQLGTFVLGVEGDLNWARANERVLIYSSEETTQFWHDRFDRYGTIRARLGVASDRWHVFATGGVAFSSLDLSFEQFENGVLENRYARGSSNGWAAGAGAEYAILPGWVARLEYLYHRFDSRLLRNDGNQYFTRANDPHFHVVRIGFTRRFDPR